MKSYLLKRILFSLFSLLVVTGVVMWMTYDLLDRDLIFANDQVVTHLSQNEAAVYKHEKFVQLGYEDYVNYAEYLPKKYAEKYGADFLENAEYNAQYNASKDYLKLANPKDSIEENFKKIEQNEDVLEFINYYKKQGYTIKFLPKKLAFGKIVSFPYLIAYKQYNVFRRLWGFVTGLFTIETINDVKDEELTNRYIRWEWDKRSNMPALVGNGTRHKFLIYFDNNFPFIHQNIIHLSLGQSVVSYKGTDVADVLSMNTGSTYFSMQEYPVDLGTGVLNETSYDFHTVTYSSSISDHDATIYGVGEHYINAKQNTSGLTRIGNSFVMGILSTIICYIIGLPMGIWMARRKDKLVDKIGNGYIIFIMSVPSLAYIFAFAAIGVTLGFPIKWASAKNLFMAMFLPVISLSLPAIGGHMKWMRRYMIDQSNADYVKFARSTGMTEGEIFSKHIAKNAFIYLVHGVPADILFALVGALITEKVYAVPGIGGLVTNAITAHDNGIIIAGTVFYSFLTIASLILGDLLLVKYDPRVSLADRG